MWFIAGLLPGLFVGVLIGFTVTTVARHGRAIAVALVKGALLLGHGLGRVARWLQAQVDRLVAEARADLDRAAGVEETGVEREPPSTRGLGGP